MRAYFSREVSSYINSNTPKIVNCQSCKVSEYQKSELCIIFELHFSYRNFKHMCI